MIECTSIYLNKKLLPKKKLKFRASVYALVVNRGKILLLNMRTTNKYFFPGGGIEVGEKAEEALKREVLEEAGIKIKIEKIIHFEESFFYYNHTNEAFHNFSLFYICKPLSFKLVDDGDVDDREAEKPRWVDIKKIKSRDFHWIGGKIFKLINK